MSSNTKGLLKAFQANEIHLHVTQNSLWSQLLLKTTMHRHRDHEGPGHIFQSFCAHHRPRHSLT